MDSTITAEAMLAMAKYTPEEVDAMAHVVFMSNHIKTARAELADMLSHYSNMLRTLAASPSPEQDNG